jgi:Tfp pilus assembly protein PilF
MSNKIDFARMFVIDIRQALAFLESGRVARAKGQLEEALFFATENNEVLELAVEEADRRLRSGEGG